jgi:CHAD domain-containing protein
VATVSREIERKYDAAGAAVAALDSVRSMSGVAAGVVAVSQQQDQTLDAIYYDTADLRLIRHGVTLRRRTGGQDSGWHLKLPAATDTRDEIRLPLGTPAAGTAGAVGGRRDGPPVGKPGGAVPEELAALVRAHTRAAALAPVVRMRTTRGVLQLFGDGGRVLAEIATDHVSAELIETSAVTAWDELEVELVAGDRGLLEAVDARLRAAGVRAAPTATKLERALGDRLRTARQAAGGGSSAEADDGLRRLTSRSPAGDVVLAYMRRQARAITHYDPLVRRDEPDAVHQMRVATRRARSALQAFGEIVERARTRALCDELKWLATALGQARDAEVLLARFTDELARTPHDLVVGPVKARITSHFASELGQAREAAVDGLDGQRYLALLDSLDALIADPPLTPVAARKAGKALAKPVRRAARRLERALAAIPDAGDKDAAIHEARKAAKRARYAAEAAAPALGGKAGRHVTRTKKLQGLLGDHHDSVVARTVLVGIADQARDAAEDTFTYGLMYQRQACQAIDIERSLPGMEAVGKR